MNFPTSFWEKYRRITMAFSYDRAVLRVFATGSDLNGAGSTSPNRFRIRPMLTISMHTVLTAGGIGVAFDDRRYLHAYPRKVRGGVMG